MDMRTERLRRCIIARLQEEIRTGTEPVALRYGKGHSNTTRSKSYQKGCRSLSCSGLNHVLSVDTNNLRVHVEPRVTMEELVRATLPYGLLPPVIPEFKGITVGGALMGAAAESTSHAWGLFHDTCTTIELLDGKGNLIEATRNHNPDLFYGISGSYGAFGLLVSATLELIPVQPAIHLHYTPFNDAHKALSFMESLVGNVDFLDGIIFSPHHSVIIAGNMTSQVPHPPSTLWYAQRVQGMTGKHEEILPLYDYLFRYDQGAFWMGSLLFSLPFLSRYIAQGLCKRGSPHSYFTPEEVAQFKKLPYPNGWARALTRSLLGSQRLWGLLHKAESWIQDRLVIQDCSIPTPSAHSFLEVILHDPGVYPIWLCPLKGTLTPQHFAPHYGHPGLINFGLYGVAAYSAPMADIMARLEAQTALSGGRKVLYSRSYYTEEAFWKIYPRMEYEQLRQKTHAAGTWRGLTEKVLSQ